jgi:hypothetical protein
VTSQVEGQGGRRDAEALGDRAGRQPGRAGGHQQAEQRQPGVLGQRTKCRYRVILIHPAVTHISMNLEIWNATKSVNRYFEEHGNNFGLRALP